MAASAAFLSVLTICGFAFRKNRSPIKYSWWCSRILPRITCCRALTGTPRLGPPAGDPKRKTRGAMADAQRISTLAVRTVSRVATDVDAFAEKALTKAWPSYMLILLLQSKVIWRIWEIKDLTYGDTSSYFETAR